MSDSQVAKHGRAAVGERRRPWSRGYDPIVQAVGRVPAKVHTKLLIAFVGTSVLLVAVGLLGLRVLGQSNGRVGSLGSLQERAVGYARLQQDAKLVRELLAQNASRDYSGVWPGATPSDRGGRRCPSTRRSLTPPTGSGPRRLSIDWGSHRPRETPTPSVSIRLKADQLSTLMQEIIQLDKEALAARRLRTSAHGPKSSRGTCIRMRPCSPTESRRRSTT